MPQLAAMQQYCVSPLGYAPLQQWAEAFNAQQHSPPCHTVTGITTGSNCALEVCAVPLGHACLPSPFGGQPSREQRHLQLSSAVQ